MRVGIEEPKEFATIEVGSIELWFCSIDEIHENVKKAIRLKKLYAGSTCLHQTIQSSSKNEFTNNSSVNLFFHLS